MFGVGWYYSSQMVKDRLRHQFGGYLGKAEATIYSVLALLLSITALVAIAGAARLLWDGLSHWTIAVETLRVLDQLLVVLMLVEILHTVRISIRSHYSGHRAIPRGWPDCFDSADTGDYPGSLHSYQRRIVVDPGRQHFSRFHA